MNELLTESTFMITKNEQGKDVLGIYQIYNDGYAQVGGCQQMIELTKYGMDALEKNLKSLLLAILNHRYPHHQYTIQGKVNDYRLNEESQRKD